MITDWTEYFDNLARNEIEEPRKAGWGSLESMYSKFYIALRSVSLGSKKRLLDVGCGTGAFLKLLAERYPQLETFGIDVSREQLKFAQRNNSQTRFVVGSIVSIPYPDVFFDCVTVIGVLQNFSGSLDISLSELQRVLKPGGELFIVTMDADYVGFKSGEKKPNLLNTYYVPEELSELIQVHGIGSIRMGAISADTLTGNIVPLHQSHTFFIHGKKNGNE